MGKAIKWVAIVVGGLMVLILAALLIIPMFVDVQKYKPEIEKKVAETTGRPFVLGGDLKLSLFPWAGLAFSDLHLGNPPGFKEKDFLSVKSFEARVRLIPLLSKNIQVNRFVLEGAEIVLVKNKDGHGNWEGLGKSAPSAKPTPSRETSPVPQGEGGLPIASLAVGEFTVSGSLLWIDHAANARKEVSDISIRLQDVTLDRPVTVAISARLDGKPISLQGTAGPIGNDPGKGDVNLDLTLKALEELDIALKGKIMEPATRQAFDLALKISPFSPRKLIASLDQAFPFETADSKALTRITLDTRIQGDPKGISLSDGKMELDESKLDFTLQAKAFEKPDIAFDITLDKIDLDRYLAPPSKKTSEGKESGVEEKGKTPAVKKKMDYTPLRRLVLDGKLHAGRLQAKGARLQDIDLKVAARNGRIQIDPLALKLYEGGLDAKAVMDVSKDEPGSTLIFSIKGVQAAPLLKDFMNKEVIEGTVNANADIAMTGDTPERIKSSLNGNGKLAFADGAIIGIDIPGMVRNVKATFGMAEKPQERPKTDFSELLVPFTLKNGVFNTPQSSLKSPLLRVLAKGDADLVRETLDFRIEPKFVGTLKGQGAADQVAGIMVPVLVTGTFASPSFAPDMKGILESRIKGGIPTRPEDLKGLLKGGEESGAKESVEEKTQGIIKGLFGK